MRRPPPPRRSSTCDVSSRVPFRKRMRPRIPRRRAFMHTHRMTTRLELLLLAALAPGPRPAHRLADEVRGRGVVPSADAFFDAVHRLERDGLVASRRSARRRRSYRLTPLGRARLESER